MRRLLTGAVLACAVAAPAMAQDAVPSADEQLLLQGETPTDDARTLSRPDKEGPEANVPTGLLDDEDGVETMGGAIDQTSADALVGRQVLTVEGETLGSVIDVAGSDDMVTAVVVAKPNGDVVSVPTTELQDNAGTLMATAPQ